jgi:hypothetical protein
VRPIRQMIRITLRCGLSRTRRTLETIEQSHGRTLLGTDAADAPRRYVKFARRCPLCLRTTYRLVRLRRYSRTPDAYLLASSRHTRNGRHPPHRTRPAYQWKDERR